MSNSISPRPTLEQVVAMLNFFEKHPNLALGKMKGGVEAREEAKKLWVKLSRVLNSLSGPTKPIKSWMKFWTDKKSNVKIKVHAAGGDPSSLLSNTERRIWNQFLSLDRNETRRKGNVKKVSQHAEDNLSHNDVDANNGDIEFEEQPVLDFEERNISIMERLGEVMEEQATAMAQMAHAAQVSAQAMERLAENSHLQARAIEKLADTFAAIASSTSDLRNAIVTIDDTVKRFYTPPSFR